MALAKELREDIDGLTGYIFEHELEDFVECLLSEPLYLEEGILSEEEIEELDSLRWGVSSEGERAMELVIKASLNPNCRHIYALAYRIWYNMLRNS